MHIFLEGAVVITNVIKTAFCGDKADFIIRMFEKLHALLNPVIVQVGERRHVRHGFKQAANVPFAQAKMFCKL